MPNEKKNQHVDDALTAVNQAKRKSLLALVAGAGFIAPLVASFSMKGVSSYTVHAQGGSNIRTMTGPIFRLVFPTGSDFGYRFLCRPYSTIMCIFNDGDAPLTWTSITSSHPDFSIISGGSGTLAVGTGSADVIVQFVANTPSLKSSLLEVVSNAESGHRNTVVTGAGILGFSGENVGFPTMC